MNTRTRLMYGALLGMTITAAPSLAAPESKTAILGVWTLKEFFVLDDTGKKTDWCRGAKGTIAYHPGYMNVAINCVETTKGSQAETFGGSLFYSGPFEIDSKTGDVIHRVRNFSHPDLNRVLRRSVEMSDKDNLKLSGKLGNGQIVLTFSRRETFAFDQQNITGVYDLVGSENRVEGSSERIPFCSGFYGNIVFTPGGFTAVSINCEKKKPNVIEPADQFGRKYFYAGTWTPNGTRASLSIENASVLKQLGEKFDREVKYDLEKDVLTLEGTNGSHFVARWKKTYSYSSISER